MSSELTMSLSPEVLDFGSQEERATFGLFAVTAYNHLLTAGQDVERKELRHGPFVSGYPIAEWLVWNWWRLRWEIGRPSDKVGMSRWDFAHRMPTIGEGYAWPNITISSDGVQSFLVSEPSRSPEVVMFRYLGAPVRLPVPATELEDAIDGFVEDILTRLAQENVGETNLHRLWEDLRAERGDPDLARFRRLEAQLRNEPDEGDEDMIRLHLNDATELGEDALGEIAAHAAASVSDGNGMIRPADFARLATRSGFEADPSDAITLENWTLDNQTDTTQSGEIEAWRLGERCARRIRDQEKLDGLPMNDETLTAFAGATKNTLAGRGGHPSKISFALDGEYGRSLVWLRSGPRTGRRFDLARLIGDRVLRNQMNRSPEPLLPATRSTSYRQKMQRAFAAELLSPFVSVDEMMSGDYSEERQNQVAKYFHVSPMTIRTQLVNHHRIDREDAPDIVARSPFS